MDDLTPPFLRILRELIFLLESGDSMSVSLPKTMAVGHGEFLANLNHAWALKRQAHPIDIKTIFKNPYYEIFWELVERGLSAQPVVPSLKHLLEEAESLSRADLERHISLLPFKALVPLLFFQFPAFLVLMIGPLLRGLSRIAFALALLTIWPPARAEPLEQVLIKKLEAATSPTEIARTRQNFREIVILRQSCRIQLAEKRLPFSCFHVLSQEKVFGLITSSEDERKTRRRLNQRCMDTRDIEFDIPVAEKRYLSEPCREHLQKVEALVRYRHGD